MSCSKTTLDAEQAWSKEEQIEENTTAGINREDVSSVVTQLRPAAETARLAINRWLISTRQPYRSISQYLAHLLGHVTRNINTYRTVRMYCC